MARTCSCGSDVVKVEIRVLERCARGHFVSSHVAPAQLQTGPEPQTPGQQRAFYAKAGQLDRARGVPAGTTKQEILDTYGIDSTTMLDSMQMSGVLDDLEARLAREGK